MGVTLGQLAGERAEATITTAAGATLWFAYRPGQLTPRFVRSAKAAYRTALRSADANGNAASVSDEEALRLADDADEVTAFLAAVLLDWDLEYPDPVTGQPSGRKLPIADGLQDLDYEIQGLMYGEIARGQRLGESNGARLSTPSASPSSRAERRATSRRKSRTGTR